MNFGSLPVGLRFEHFDIDQHLAAAGQAITVKDGQVGILTKDNFTPVINIADISWTFGGQYAPSVYNLMFAVGVLLAQQDLKSIPDSMIASIKNYQLDEAGGRLTLFENKDTGVKVLADFAHEKYSLIDQIRRSSRSIPANIAEAWRKRRYPKSFVSKLTDSWGEEAEVEVWLDMCRDCNYLSDERFVYFSEKYEEVSKMLYSMIEKPEKFCH